jgi:glycosyltransferase involved in cell wall biosynthesis
MKRGGAEMRTLEIMRAVSPDRFQFDCLALSGQRGDLDDEVRAIGGEVHHLARSIFFAHRFKDLLVNGQYDVVHSHVLYFSGFILRWAHQVGVSKRIAHFRSAGDGSDHGMIKRMYHLAGKRLIDRHANVILAVSDHAMRVNWGRDARDDSRCQVVYNGMQTGRFSGAPDRGGVRNELGIPENGKIILHVGNVTPPKNHRRVLEIFRDIAGSRENIHLVLIGAGTELLKPLADDLLASSNGLTKRIRYCGSRSDIPRLMLASDVLIHPSTAEGLPGAVLEAVAAGLVVVASDIPAIAEISQHLPTVTRVPLQENNAFWGEKIDRALAVSVVDRATAVHDFEDSVFGLHVCVRRLEQVWSA